MKKTILLFIGVAIFSFAIPKALTSQSSRNFSFGLRSHFGGMKGLNNIIDHYNNSRTWLDNSLGNQSFQNGFEIGYELSEAKVGISFFKYFRVWNVSTAKGTTPLGEEIKRKLKTRVGGLELFDFWATPINLLGFNIGGGVMPMGGGVYRVHTKLNEKKWRKLPLSDLENLGEKGFFSTFHPFSNFHIDITKSLKNTTLHIQFLYSRNWFQDEYNLIYVNKELNPSTFNSANYRQKHGQNNYGLKLYIVI